VAPVYNVIPYPSELLAQKGFFRVSKDVLMAIPKGHPELKANADYLNTILKDKLGYALKQSFYDIEPTVSKIPMIVFV